MHGRVRDRCQPRLQLGDDALGLRQPRFHRELVRIEDPARQLRVTRVQDLAHLVERDVERA